MMMVVVIGLNGGMVCIEHVHVQRLSGQWSMPNCQAFSVNIIYRQSRQLYFQAGPDADVYLELLQMDSS